MLVLLLLLLGIAGDSVSGAPNSSSTQVFPIFSTGHNLLADTRLPLQLLAYI